MRELKFEFLYRGMPYSSESPERPWFKKIYTLTQLVDKSVAEMSDVHSFSDLIAKRQFTGVLDFKGNEVFEGDVIEDVNGRSYFVEFNQEWAAFVFHRVGWKILKSIDDLRGIVIIGNVHQNPEMVNL